MSSYKMDQLQFSSGLPNFINIGNLTTQINVTGTVGASGELSLPTANVNLSNSSNFIAIYAYNNLTGRKCSVVSIGSLYYNFQQTSVELCRIYTTITNNVLGINIFIDNSSASPVTITNQIYTFTIVQYQLPF